MLAAWDVRAIAALAGPMVLVAYAIGWALAEWRATPDRPVAAVPPALAEVGVALLLATAAWEITDAIAPGNGRALSPIGYLSVQILAAWQSLALWTGAGLVAGICRVFGPGRPSSAGLAAAGALCVAYAPFVVVTAAAGYLAAWALGKSGGAVLASLLIGAMAGHWVGWIVEGPDLWGMRLGPEISVWVTVLAMITWVGHRSGGRSDLDLLEATPTDQ